MINTTLKCMCGMPKNGKTRKLIKEFMDNRDKKVVFITCDETKESVLVKIADIKQNKQHNILTEFDSLVKVINKLFKNSKQHKVIYECTRDIAFKQLLESLLLSGVTSFYIDMPTRFVPDFHIYISTLLNCSNGSNINRTITWTKSTSYPKTTKI